MKAEAISVAELTSYIKRTLEENFEGVSVIGELSNFKQHYSGHWYFTLKDADAQISCTMWRGINNYVFFSPQDGMKVVVTGNLTVYPPRGSYQIDVRSMQPAGVGELQLAFEKLKQKLKEEGLFDEEFKKSLPTFPEKIGIITSIDGAAKRDLLSVAERRFPMCELIIYPAKVQGGGAAESVVAGIKALNKIEDIDAIVIARGGGSLEDLWAFNEEILARAIFNSDIPIITGIGHETDFTIADFVADIRAATPTAAMEILLPDQLELRRLLGSVIKNLTEKMEEILSSEKRNLKYLRRSSSFIRIENLVALNSQKLDNAVYQLFRLTEQKLERIKNALSLFTAKLETGNVQTILKKGFVLVKQHNKFVTKGANLLHDEQFLLRFNDKEIEITPK